MSADRIRIDKWLWYARFFKSRTLAGKFCQAGKMRVNDKLITKANIIIGPDDVLTFAIGTQIKVAKIIAVGTRRGPAPEAQALYEDLSPPPAPKAFRPAKVGVREAGAGRPTKTERRAIDKLQGRD